jgi:hypothetical protein
MVERRTLDNSLTLLSVASHLAPSSSDQFNLFVVGVTSEKFSWHSRNMEFSFTLCSHYLDINFFSFLTKECTFLFSYFVQFTLHMFRP